ncbi:MAG: phosphoglucosamine mutase [Bacteroidales bacterium]|jgi:phosphomannomutase|nr:phosphoglucosamine mutase [Bacteroidales bacterium]
MTLITSISGIRGTIGGIPGSALTPLDAVKFASAYAGWLKQSTGIETPTVVLGRDARISGEMVDMLVSGALLGMGVNVINLSLATTPTVEIAVTELDADGGIILTASHNPKHWNALKLLNSKGEFLSGADGEEILQLVKSENFNYSEVDQIGKISTNTSMDDHHIQKVIDLPLVDIQKIRAANFSVALDCVNSVGGKILPKLLKKLGVREVIELYCDPTGEFPHNPEPLPQNLSDISATVIYKKADVGFVVDPDVDRLAIVCEDGSMFGEEYTLVAVADYILAHTPGSTCSNLSSSRALRYVTEKHGQVYHASAVGEVNVVEKMKAEDCVIGGEGNGGIIYPELHYGRDALVGIALFLTHLANEGLSCSELRLEYPSLEMIKNKITLEPTTDVDKLLEELEVVYKEEEIITIDGLKIDFDHGWVHLRKSNTEPIIRVYAESGSLSEAEELVSGIMKEVMKILN